MRYMTFGRSGLRVSELAFGLMRLNDVEAARPMLDLYAEAGGNFLDTADRYGRGRSEEILGELLGARRDRFVVATKYTLERDEDDVNSSGNQRKNLVRALDASLKRLRTDYVDVYWVHSRDALTPVEEVMRALDDQVRAGKILYAGASDWPSWEVAQANTIAELRGWTRFDGVQVPYSLVDRTTEREQQPMAQGLGLAVCAWSPLGGGLLSGRDDPDPRRAAIARAVTEIAGELRALPAQVALAWVRGRADNVIPLVGASSERQLRENLGCLELELAPEHTARLNELSDTGLGYPYELLRNEAVLDLVYGKRRAGSASI